MNELKLQYYRTAFLQTQRGNYRGTVINAKPIFLITTFDLIETEKVFDNKFFYNKSLMIQYRKNFEYYEPNNTATPLYKPFYHLSSDSYWNLKYKEIDTTGSITAKFIRNNIEYGSFDNALWDLLQDAETRNCFRKLIIEKFIKQTYK